MLFSSVAHAMAPAPGGAGGEPNALMMLVPWIAIFAVFYFLLIRPQQKRAKEHKAMLGTLKRGDEIITAGGIYGRIVETAEDYLIIDLGDAKMKVSRAAVSGLVGASKPAVADKKAAKGKDSESSK